ncbi:hypothetical protein [Aeromonas veronii]|uniref:Uncharacterized protein n=1 Tax=Aeromonas veronii TaxID=654 RepID=A0ABY3MFN3_AERVE|nr:hypothetical protein [Aeromonas veronii]RDU77840.1 hypothetical protein CHF44_21580 [Aeromonas veronii]RDU77975.1 hypothetical protein CGZ76_22400 [Aeromonas veronii]RDU88058.1 hypothetical protein CHH34_20660 [Aeromonas veronii]TEY43938.1 hypothetical protein CIG14_22160 [Aeromonas veronii]TEY57612.1 hypothetical protein CIG15_21235 [Aeromonas veronii]
MKVNKITFQNVAMMFKSAEITEDGNLEINFDVRIYEQAQNFSILNEKYKTAFMIVDGRMMGLSFLTSNGFDSITYHIE